MNASFLRLGSSRPGRYFCSLLAPAAKTENVASPPTPRKKILVVDDDPIILMTMSLKLKSWGFEVATAVDASTAIGAVRDERPDLVLLDLSFPPDVPNGGRVTWDGFQIMSWLRGMDEASLLPFIIITGGEPALFEERALASGAVAFFHKPIQHDDLLRMIQQALDRPDPALDKKVA